MNKYKVKYNARVPMPPLGAIYLEVPGEHTLPFVPQRDMVIELLDEEIVIKEVSWNVETETFSVWDYVTPDMERAGAQRVMLELRDRERAGWVPSWEKWPWEKDVDDGSTD